MTPYPTNYTATEGAEWLSSEGIDLSSTSFAAVMFSDGTIWDQILGAWRGDLTRDPFIPDKPMQTVSKPSVGRPTDYLPEYCDRVISYCAQGLSLTAFAGNISVSRSTITQWMENHPEFSSACKTAMAKRSEYLEISMLDREATGPMVTARRFGLVNANVGKEPSDWREKSETETTINKGDGWSDLFALIGNQSKSI